MIPRRSYMLSAIIWSILIFFPAQAQQSFEAITNRSDVRISAQKHRVMAFYYPWYTLPDTEEEEPKHWGEIDRERMTISKSTNYPLKGPYDSNDPKVIQRHMKWAQNNGIDTYIVSWWGHGSYAEKPMDDLLEAADQYDLNITVYYERVPGNGEHRKTMSAVEDIDKLLSKYADHPAWLRVNDRPVLFIYKRAVQQLGLQDWALVQKILRNKHSSNPILIGDQLSAMSALVFDGIHTYNPVSSLIGKRPKQVNSWANEAYMNWIDMAERAERISTITVIPGYDDTKIREPGTRVPRYGGQLYSSQWKQVKQTNPDWILITSFNEWHEGSDIEPSVEYGHRYLELTGRHATPYKSRPLRVSPGTDAPINQSKLTNLRRQLKKIRIGILPQADSAVLPWLVSRLNVAPQLVQWKRLAERPPDPEQMPILIYARGEHYKQTVNDPNDVTDALRNYMKSGGLLMVLPSGPTPFHYNLSGDPVPGSEALGLPLEVGGKNGVYGWETPPENEQLTFVQPDHLLPHTPSSLSFPSSGDVRWRPFNPGKLSENDRHTSLLKLKNEQGAYRGDAVTYTEFNTSKSPGGKLVYCWFRLLDMEQAEPLLYDLFTFVVEKVK